MFENFTDEQMETLSVIFRNHVLISKLPEMDVKPSPDQDLELNERVTAMEVNFIQEFAKRFWAAPKAKNCGCCCGCGPSTEACCPSSEPSLEVNTKEAQNLSRNEVAWVNTKEAYEHLT